MQLVVNHFSGDPLYCSRWAKHQVQRFPCAHRCDRRPRAAPLLNAVADIRNKHSFDLSTHYNQFLLLKQNSWLLCDEYLLTIVLNFI